MEIRMVDLHRQYLRLKSEIDGAMQKVIDSSAFINGPEVKDFSAELADYMSCRVETERMPCR